MSWTQKTFHRGGGDIPYRDERYYVYAFRDKWWRRLEPYRATVKVPFLTVEYGTLADYQAHHNVLCRPDFHLNGINIMEWAKETITQGNVHFSFLVDAGDPFEEAISGRNSKVEFRLTARFSDRRMAILFKLTFG